MSGFPLGVARRALDELAQLAPTKRRGTSTVPIADNSKVQYDIGGADAALLAARAFLLRRPRRRVDDSDVRSGTQQRAGHAARARRPADDEFRRHCSRPGLRGRRRERRVHQSPAPTMRPRHPHRQPTHRLRRPVLQRSWTRVAHALTTPLGDRHCPPRRAVPAEPAIRDTPSTLGTGQFTQGLRTEQPHGVPPGDSQVVGEMRTDSTSQLLGSAQTTGTPELKSISTSSPHVYRPASGTRMWCR